MKKQILFVDDDAFVLSALRRLMRSHRDVWDVSFASNGNEAIQIMADLAFDVVVTDVRMPVMDGFELLDHVRNVHPNAIRIILSGQTDSDTDIRPVGPTHHCLTKPCSPDELRTTIQRAIRLQDELNREASGFPELSIHQFPVTPECVVDLRRAINRGETDPDIVAQIIRQDPILTLRVLMFANDTSAQLIGAATVAEAIKLMGARRILENVAANADQQIAIDTLTHTTLVEECLRYSQQCAELAQQHSAGPVVVNESKLAGLAINIGPIAVLVAKALGNDITHQNTDAIGALLIRSWAFSNSVAEAIAFRNSDIPTNSQSFTPLDAFRKSWDPIGV